MRYEVNYKDGVTLTDDAYLYEIGDLRKIFCEWVPRVSDEGTRCVFELDGCDEAETIPDLLLRLEKLKDEDSLQQEGFLQQAETELRRVSEILKNEGKKQNRVVERCLPVPGVDYLVGRSMEDEQVKCSLFMLYGLTRDEKGVSVSDVAQWLEVEAGKMANIRERLEKARLEKEQAECERLEMMARYRLSRKKTERTKKIFWLVVFWVLSALLAVALLSSYLKQKAVYNEITVRVEQQVAVTTFATDTDVERVNAMLTGFLAETRCMVFFRREGRRQMTIWLDELKSYSVSTGGIR